MQDLSPESSSSVSGLASSSILRSWNARAHCASRFAPCAFAKYQFRAVVWRLVAAEERAERGFFAFDIALHGCGRLIRYQGWVRPH